MDQYDARRPDALPHAGTFNNNVLTMAAGVTAMRDLYTAEVATAHSERGEAFKARVNEICRSRGFPAQITGLGSLLCLHFVAAPIVTPGDAQRTDPHAIALFHLFMLERGFYTSKGGLMSLSLPLAANDYDAFVAALVDFIEQFHAQFQAIT